YQRRTYRSLRQIWGTPDDLQPDERERIQMLSARLLLELRRLPDGPAKFRRLVFLASKGRWDSGEFFEIYRSDFPSPQEAEKWWTARLARPPDLPRLAGMGLLETCRRLSAILEDGYPEPGLTGLRASDMKSVNESENQLYQLMLRGHPMTRPAIEAAINALEALKINDTRRARPAWENAGTILQALVPWKQQIDAELDRQEYLRAPPTPGQWLDQKGVGGD
ncbi:MAG: hypothetical protein JO317_02930, partial [Verrucomicrobiae bacterium]|nr:hypothetical protein [Verrucomicrobiae bacterium]